MKTKILGIFVVALLIVGALVVTANYSTKEVNDCDCGCNGDCNGECDSVDCNCPQTCKEGCKNGQCGSSCSKSSCGC